MPSITRTTDLYSVTSEDLAPYAERYVMWRTAQGSAMGTIESDWSLLLAAPTSHQWHLSQFRTWLVDQEPIESAIPESTDRRALGEALAAMRRRERDAKADAHQAHLDLIQARQALIEAQERAAQPFDSEHPQWREFWLTAARNATRSGHCPEYDRHAELMGGITRDEFRADGETLYSRERVSYTVTVTFSYSDVVDNGEESWIVNASERELAELAYNNRYDITDATVEEDDREEYGD